MAKYIREWDDHIFETEEEAREDCYDSIEWDDIVNTIEYSDTIDWKDTPIIALLKELRRLDSPLFWDIYEATYEGCFDERYYLTGEEEEEENDG